MKHPTDLCVCVCVCVSVCVYVCICNVMYCLLLLDMNEIKSLTVYKDLYVFFCSAIYMHWYTYTHLACIIFKVLVLIFLFFFFNIITLCFASASTTNTREIKNSFRCRAGRLPSTSPRRAGGPQTAADHLAAARWLAARSQKLSQNETKYSFLCCFFLRL